LVVLLHALNYYNHLAENQGVDQAREQQRDDTKQAFHFVDWSDLIETDHQNRIVDAI